MKFQKCPQVIIDSKGNLGTPRCMNFWKELDGKTNVCSGIFCMHCVPYTDEEIKKLSIYWKCKSTNAKGKK